MKFLKNVPLLIVLGAAATPAMAQDYGPDAGPDMAQDDQAEGGSATVQDDEIDREPSDSWSITVTPRVQQLFFKPSFETDDLEAMTSYGLSVAVRSPSSGFGIMGTFMTGEANGVYSIDNSGPFGGAGTSNYGYDATREEYQLTGEFTPRNTNFTLLAGYHRFTAGANETLQNPTPGNTENNVVNLSIDALELGMRLSSALGEGSRHSVSAQFLFGVGSGKYEATFQEQFAGVTTTTTFDEDATGYMADIAIGYNFFITDSIAIGARGRGYMFYVDADTDENDPIFALAPELNLSFRF